MFYIVVFKTGGRECRKKFASKVIAQRFAAAHGGVVVDPAYQQRKAPAGVSTPRKGLACKACGGTGSNSKGWPCAACVLNSGPAPQCP
jgi:hypothetical protein